MQLEVSQLTHRTTSRTDVIDLTPEINQRVQGLGVQQGQVTVFVPGSTGAITTIEYEEGVVEDLRAAIERMAPEELTYQHNLRWGDGNGYSHVRAALVGPSLTVPIIDGELALGTWQQVVLLDFDNRPRERRILIQVLAVT